MRSAPLVVVAFIALGGCTDDGGDTAAVSSGADVCAAYADVNVAVDELAAYDVLAWDQAEAEAAVDAVVESVTSLSEVAVIDDDDVLLDINAVLAEIPPGEDPRVDQLALQALRDDRDIMVADVRAWLEGSGIECG
jgi:hypothetical protein